MKDCGNVWGIPIWVLVLPAVSWFVIYYLCQAEEMILIGDKNGDGKIEYEGSYYKPVKIALDKHCCRRNTDIFRC